MKIYCCACKIEVEARIRGYKLEDPNWGKYPSKKKNKIKKRKIKEEINKLKEVRK